MQNRFIAAMLVPGLCAGLATFADAPATDEQLLKEVKVPEGFDVTLFARPPMVNYPVFVAAAPDGTLYVSSDGNGSLGRDPHRGRILRLRDTDGDGRADEVKVFVADVDSPRGLVWDHDRLYVIHPPHLSCYIDADRDGVSDKEIVLVKNCAFTFKDRPADHTTNGLELGPDGWLYVTQGDFGFMEAEGTDGRKLQFRGGGIWRVRSDGRGMEMYSFGARNIVEAGVSPLLDIFARDNTNDGGGWDIRLHHFTGLDDHGYPKLYMNFNDEVVQPLADYGGGSGCGGAFLDEPGFPAGYSPSMLACDWGRSIVYRHVMTPKGATFTAGQEEFIKITRSTDVDVDAMSRIYAASWRGATFNWVGPEVGFIARITPKGYRPEALPNFEKLSDVELVKQLLSASARRRVEAQRMLLRRAPGPQIMGLVAALAADTSKPLASRVAALFTVKQAQGAASHATLAKLASDPTLRAWALRALTDRWDQVQDVPVEPILAGLKDADPRVRKEAVVAVARLGKPEHAAAAAPLLADEDPVVAHTAIAAFKRLLAAEPCFAIVDRTEAPEALRNGALKALQGMHRADVVEGLIARLTKETDVTRRKGLVVALSRLARIEGVWKGDSWGTRPDTRGPYYQPESWAETKKIEDALAAAMAKAQGEEASFLLTQFARHRINPGDASARTIELAAKDPTLVPTAVSQLLGAGNNIPPAALPLLVQAATDENRPDAVRAQAVSVLARTDSAEAFAAMLDALDDLKKKKRGGKDFDQAREAFLNAGKADQHIDLFEKRAAAGSVWADAALVRIAGRKIGSPEAKEHATKVLEAAWNTPTRKIQMLESALLAKAFHDPAKLVAAIDDADKDVAKAAKKAAGDLKIDPDKFKAAQKSDSPKLATLKSDAILDLVMKTPGDTTRGPQLFTQQGCIACHTVAKGEALKGPYLGNIATIYKRRELAEAILLPNKSIAMGFATHIFTLKDGTQQAGFVVQEAADAITIRTITSQEVRIPVAQVAKRDKLEQSIMPEQLVATLTVEDFASLVSYLEELAKSEK